MAIFVLIGLAQMSALSLGQFNLAVGAMGCLSAIVMGLFMQVLGIPVLLAVLLGLIIAMGLGATAGRYYRKKRYQPVHHYTGVAQCLYWNRHRYHDG